MNRRGRSERMYREMCQCGRSRRSGYRGVRQPTRIGNRRRYLWRDIPESYGDDDYLIEGWKERRRRQVLFNVLIATAVVGMLALWTLVCWRILTEGSRRNGWEVGNYRVAPTWTDIQAKR